MARVSFNQSKATRHGIFTADKIRFESSEEVGIWGFSVNETIMAGLQHEGADDHSIGLCVSDLSVYLLTLTANIISCLRREKIKTESRDLDEHEKNSALRSLAEIKQHMSKQQ